MAYILHFKFDQTNRLMQSNYRLHQPISLILTNQAGHYKGLSSMFVLPIAEILLFKMFPYKPSRLGEFIFGNSV